MTKPQRATPHARRQFQSTPSVWRETKCNSIRFVGCGISIHSLRVEGDREHLHLAGGPRYFNPLPPCGGRPLLPDHHVQGRSISIHSLRVEGDVNVNWLYARILISIHSLRVEGDINIICVRHAEHDFNPLPPCGGRLRSASLSSLPAYFNPLPPCGGRLFKCRQ